jgi:hypothetical protein
VECLVSYNEDIPPGGYQAAAVSSGFYGVTLSVQASVVPLPGAVWMMLSGLGLLVGMRWWINQICCLILNNQ